MILLSLLLLGITLYFIVQYSVSRVTSTPWWLLWLVLMAPAFLIAAWTVTHRSTQNMPLGLLIAAFVLSSVTYFILLSLNPRRDLPPQSVPENTADPDQLAPQPLQPPQLLNSEEQSRLQSCFPWSVYYLQNVDYRPQAVICRGQLRSEPEKAYQDIQKNVQAEFGDRFLVVFQMGAMNQPFFALVSNPHAKRIDKVQPLTRPGLALGLLIVTLITTTVMGTTFFYPDFTEEIFVKNPAILLSGLPYGIALISILGCHELGHYFTARYYKMKTTLPYFIPVPFLYGTLGAYIQLRIPAPHRKGLFDVGIAGPLAGFIVTLPILILGLLQSSLVPLPDKPTLLTPDPKFSIFFSLICRAMFGSELSTNVGVSLHPLALAGLLGLAITALNLMPVGQLDGGHIIHAMYGQRTSVIVGRITQLIVLLLAFVNPVVWSIWALILLFMPIVDEPALNDVSELDNVRDGLGLMALVLLLLIVLPVPGGLEQLLFTANPTP
jgi:membrane-associated protease RseP (regulator of RpoE activity)